MTVAKHTPGPWVVWVGHYSVWAGEITENTRGGMRGKGLVEVARVNEDEICCETCCEDCQAGYCCDWHAESDAGKQADANARLIAAAPALLEALERIGGLCGHLRAGGCDASDLQGLEEGLREAVSIAEAAIAAARGES